MILSGGWSKKIFWPKKIFFENTTWGGGLAKKNFCRVGKLFQIWSKPKKIWIFIFRTTSSIVSHRMNVRWMLGFTYSTKYLFFPGVNYKSLRSFNYPDSLILIIYLTSLLLPISLFFSVFPLICVIFYQRLILIIESGNKFNVYRNLLLK